MAKIELLVSALAVLNDDCAILPAFMQELSGVLDRNYANYEILLVDNGSVDGTSKVVRELLGRYRCVRYLRLTRPTDNETALMVGMDSAIGDYLVTLNPDFDPPEELVRMIDVCREGGDMVLGVDRHPVRPSRIYRGLRRAFVAASRRLLSVDLSFGTTGYRVLSRQAVNALVKVRVRKRYFALVAADVGLAKTNYPYDRISRSGRKPVYRLLRDVRLGLSVLVHNSIALLRLASVLGLLGSFLSLAYNLYAVLIFLLYRNVPQGWTTLSFAMSALFFVTFLMLALMGEYLSRLLDESSDRPLYHVRDEESSAVMLSDVTRRNVLDRAENTSEVINEVQA
jgi:glycosyltransferase involved in cell wall biosynthesis